MIVYVMLQRDADDVATLLIQHGYDAQAYHAGKDSAERSRVQVPTACANRPFARKAPRVPFRRRCSAERARLSHCPSRARTAAL